MLRGNVSEAEIDTQACVSLRARAFNPPRSRVRRHGGGERHGCCGNRAQQASPLRQICRHHFLRIRRKRRRSDPIRRSSAAGLRELTGGARPPPPPLPHRRSPDNEMQAHACPVQRAIITHPAQLFLPHPSAHHLAHLRRLFFPGARPPQLSVFISQSVLQPLARASIHPSVCPGRPSPSRSADLSAQSTFMHH